MYNSDKVIPGIIVFILFFTLPMWLNFGGAKAIPRPELPKGEKRCVESKDYMRSYHMKLLLKWRNMALREGRRTYIGADGKEYVISLQNTCMKCHKSNEKFCDRCHKFVATHPDCWHCHIAPDEIAKRGWKNENR